MAIDRFAMQYDAGVAAGYRAAQASLFAALVSALSLLENEATAAAYMRGYLSGIIEACRETAMARQ